jgi:peptide/nickel transport system substrate-binding protein
MSPAASIGGVRRPPLVRRLALLALVLVLVVTGCSNGYQDLPEARAARVGTTSDVNPRDPATLRDGGNLRLPLTGFPDNFNEMNIDGNTADTGDVVTPTLPGAFITQADGTLKLNTDYFTGAELTSSNPQVVTYTINPKATWSDGSPMTWEDLKSEVDACSGRDKRYLIASRAGFERVKSVTRGVDDRQAVITFAEPYTEWQAMFAGGIQPRSMTSNPDVFNKGQLEAPGPSAGPSSHGWTPSPSWYSTPPPSSPPCKTTRSMPPV